MDNPYHGRPGYTFWRTAVAVHTPETFDPVTAVPFQISRRDRVATAGSCFAQHIARRLKEDGYNYFVPEAAPQTSDAADEQFGVFSARFGNLYTVRQLHQLFRRAYGVFAPIDHVWRRRDGAFIDAFRPRVQKAGFPTIEAVEADRAAHLACVRRMFEECHVFIFTLGLTEGWCSAMDGAVFPIAPGVEGAGAPPEAYKFVNFDAASTIQDLLAFIDALRGVNPQVRILLTVSPVSLIATYEDRHVVVSTVYSKSVLRVAAEMAVQSRPNVGYFPSYEIITGPQSGGRYFMPDCRDVSDEGVAHVMSLFTRHYCLADAPAAVASVDGSSWRHRPLALGPPPLAMGRPRQSSVAPTGRTPAPVNAPAPASVPPPSRSPFVVPPPVASEFVSLTAFQIAPLERPVLAPRIDQQAALRAVQTIICDEEVLDPGRTS